jgi:hypothetical protein
MRGWMLGLLWIAIAGGAGATQLRVTVYDQAAMDEHVRTAAWDELRRIFSRAGIAAEIALGDPSADEARIVEFRDAPTAGEELAVNCAARRDIALAILPRSIPGINEWVVAVASPFARAGLNARLFADRIREAAAAKSRPLPMVLAYATAHEIGHVLLRSMAHAPHGLMAARWRDREYAAMSMGNLAFSTEEGRRMRETLAGEACGGIAPAPAQPTALPSAGRLQDVIAHLVNRSEAPMTVVHVAAAKAAEMLAVAGVRVLWHGPAPSPADDCRSIRLAIVDAPTADAEPTAQAHTDLKGGSIAIFYERLRPTIAALPNLAPTLLAHVIVREIGHSLQRLDRHSETGIMKHQWTDEDYRAMQDRPLAFADADLALLRAGLSRACDTLASLPRR